MSNVKYVILGAPRAATAYAAELLSNLGLVCGHEEYFKFEQRWQSFREHDGVLGDASWLAVPFLSKLPPEVRILHQTRDPLNVIRSLLQIQFLDLDADGTPLRTGNRARFTQFAYRHCPQLFEHATVRDRVIWFYYYWNKAIDDVATEREVLRYDIESLGPDRLKQILAHLGLPRDYVSDEMLTAHFEVLPRNINAKVREKVALTEEITWHDLPEEVQALASSYGYSPSDRRGEFVAGWNQDLADAENQVRKQARKISRTWQVERSNLMNEVTAFRDKARRAKGSEDRAHRALQAMQRELIDERAYHEHLQGDGRESDEARGEREHWMCRMVADGRVLDICCGRGRRCILLGREGLTVVGVEAAADSLAATQKALEAEHDSVRQRVQFVQATPFTAKFEPASFGTVIIGEALTRVSNPERLLRHVLSYLVDGGRLVVSVPLGYHPDQDRIHSFYMQSLLDLVGRYSELGRVEVIHQYACIVAAKPPEGTPPKPPSEEALAEWHRLGEEGLIQIQRCWLNDLADVRARNLELKRTLKHTREQLVRLEEMRRRTQAELDQRETASELLHRTQALLLRLARSNAQIPDDALTAPGAGLATPVQKSGGFLFFCVNGAGLGHVTRSLAVARRIRRVDPAMPIYFLSSSQALGAISREGMIAYYIPTRSEYGDQVGGNAWNKLLLQYLRLIVGMHGPTVLVYDGVSPYPGLLNIFAEANFTHTAMILRLRHKHDRLLKLVDRLERFDQLVFPGEPGVDVPSKLAALNHRVFDPIIYLDPDELMTREEVRRYWNIPHDKKLVYVQLGAGNIDDVGPWIEKTLSVLENRRDVEVIVAESPVAKISHKNALGARIFAQYPNSLHFHGFDLAITAAGYNTFHELMHFGVPSIFIPNQKTVTDDQVARAMTAQRANAARVVLSPDQLGEAIAVMLREDVAASMRNNAMQLVPNNGAMDVARHLLESASNRQEFAGQASSTVTLGAPR